MLSAFKSVTGNGNNPLFLMKISGSNRLQTTAEKILRVGKVKNSNQIICVPYKIPSSRDI